MRDLAEPLEVARRLLTKATTSWMRNTYGFDSFGQGTSIDYRCNISKSIARRISFGSDIYLASDVWLNIPKDSTGPGPAIVLGNGCQIGRRSMISAKNYICLEPDVLLAPSVLLMDHNHEYCDIHLPIHAQGTTAGGKITLERNCWLGYNAVVFCASGHLTIGKNSVVGANSVVTKSVPPNSVVVGNPAKLIKSYDPNTCRWIRPDD
jgi:acetyltransferase-like isoleucine patch superfamily enzyme